MANLFLKETLSDQKGPYIDENVAIAIINVFKKHQNEDQQQSNRGL